MGPAEQRLHAEGHPGLGGRVPPESTQAHRFLLVDGTGVIFFRMHSLKQANSESALCIPNRLTSKPTLYLQPQAAAHPRSGGLLVSWTHLYKPILRTFLNSLSSAHIDPS
jgi:hypothetical protein